MSAKWPVYSPTSKSIKLRLKERLLNLTKKKQKKKKEEIENTPGPYEDKLCMQKYPHIKVFTHKTWVNKICLKQQKKKRKIKEIRKGKSSWPVLV